MIKFFPLPDYQQIQKNFLDELIRASKNKPSSIAYFKHTFPKQPLIRSLSQKAISESPIVQAFVIGGTNFDVSLARIAKDGTIKEIKKERKKGTIPQFTTAKTFLRFIKKYLNPKAQALALNFAYVLNPLVGKFGEVDGVLHNITKEHAFKGLVGKPIGETIRKFINKDIPITVVNDTVCLGTNGLVVGSGFNFCLQGTNLEAGNFNRFEGTEELETIDKAATNPGGHRFEKFISGYYLPYHFNLLAKKHQFAINHVANGKELTDLAEHDLGVAGDLARSLLERSASLVACALAGAYLFMNKKTLTFTTEGSLFWKGFMFKTNVKRQLLALGIQKGAIRFKKVENSSMQGALALLIRTQ